MTKNRKKNRENKEKKVLNYIKKFLEENGYSPSYRDIAGVFGCSTSTVFKRLHSLREQNLICFEDDKNRTLRIVEQEG